VVAKCTYLLKPRNTVFIQMLIAFYGTRQLSLSSASSIHSIPPSHFLKILILSFHPCLGLPSRLFPSDFPTKTLYAPLLHTCYMSRPSHYSRFDHPRNILESNTDHWAPNYAVLAKCALSHGRTSCLRPDTSHLLHTVILVTAICTHVSMVTWCILIWL